MAAPCERGNHVLSTEEKLRLEEVEMGMGEGAQAHSYQVEEGI